MEPFGPYRTIWFLGNHLVLMELFVHVHTKKIILFQKNNLIQEKNNIIPKE